MRGIERIVATINKHDIRCGLLRQDSLFLACRWQGGRRIGTESAMSCGFTDQQTYDASQTARILGAQGYNGWDPLRRTWSQLQGQPALKNLLVDNGMQIFEHRGWSGSRMHRFTHAAV